MRAEIFSSNATNGVKKAENSYIAKVGSHELVTLLRELFIELCAAGAVV